jgi:lipoate-protein ligase A
MRCIFRTETNPYFNLAAEEFAFKNFSGNTFMLWTNDPAIIIGKHQNAFAEINHQFVEANNIKVVRRISGGGTVYHDSGNLNFSFINNAEKSQTVDFSRFTLPIISVLGKLGVEAHTGLKNSIFTGQHKISGNAEHLYKNTVLHHGTLLYNSDLTVLEKAIKPPAIIFEDKAIKSVRSTVGNISDFMPSLVEMKEFSGFVFAEIIRMNPGSYEYQFSPADIEAINELAEKKYKTWEWNYGYSPAFQFKTLIETVNAKICCVVKVVDGIIRDITPNNQAEIEIPGVPGEFNVLREALTGIPMQSKLIRQKLSTHYTGPVIDGIIDSLFTGKVC